MAIVPARVRVALAALGLLASLAILAPLVTPAAPEELDLTHRRAAPSGAHPFGTDELGRDVLSRVLFAARVSLLLGLLSAAVASVAGASVGAVSGYASGAVDMVLMRLTDAMLVVPRLPLLMTACAVLQPGLLGLIALVGLVGWMEVARLVRARVQTLRTLDFVAAARACGASEWRIVLRHLVPGVSSTLAVATTLAVARAILLESALSFFGVGVQPPTPSWGNMLYQAQTTMSSAPWLALVPGACILLTTISVQMVGEGVER